MNKKFQEEELPKEYIRIFTIICLSIQYLHSEGFIHGKIKPPNFLIFFNERNKLYLKTIDYDL